MFSLVRREGPSDTTLCRTETEQGCRDLLAAVLPTLPDGQSVLFIRTDNSRELRVLGTYMRPPRLES